MKSRQALERKMRNGSGERMSSVRAAFTPHTPAHTLLPVPAFPLYPGAVSSQAASSGSSGSDPRPGAHVTPPPSGSVQHLHTTQGATRSTRSTQPSLPAQQFLDDLSQTIVQQLLSRAPTDFTDQCVVHIALNARGRGQFELRLPYTTFQAAKEMVAQDIFALAEQIQQGLHQAKIKLASEE